MHIPFPSDDLKHDNIYELLYLEANEHLRENDKKRDQILIIIVTLSGAVFGFYEKVKGLASEFKLSILILILILSAFIPFILIEYRKWHIIYHLSAKVLQQIMYFNRERVSVQLIRDLLSYNVRKPTLSRFIVTTETMIYNLTLCMNIFNIYILLCAYGKVNIYASVGLFIGYIVFYNYIHFRMIKNLFNKILTEEGYRTLWLLDFAKSPFQDIYENKYLKVSVNNENRIKVINKNNGCIVIPITSENKVVLVEVFRDTVNEAVLELPRGFAEESENTEDAAKRELKEEIGAECKKIVRIGSFYPDTGFYVAKIDIFIAYLHSDWTSEKCSYSENINAIHEFEISKVYSKLFNGDLKDGYTIVALLFAYNYLTNFDNNKNKALQQ